MSAARATLPPVQIPTLQLAVTVIVVLAGAFAAWGSMDARVQAQEKVTEPIARGELVRIDERMKSVQQDVAWMRDRMEKGQ